MGLLFCFLPGRCRLAGFAVAWSSRQMKYIENGVAGFDLLALHNGAAQTHFLGSRVVLKHGLAVLAKPRIVRAGNGNLNFRVFLHVLVNVLGIAGAEPQLAIQLAGKHEGAALDFAVAVDGGQILYGIGVQKFYDFLYVGYLQRMSRVFSAKDCFSPSRVLP